MGSRLWGVHDADWSWDACSSNCKLESRCSNTVNNALFSLGTAAWPKLHGFYGRGRCRYNFCTRVRSLPCGPLSRTNLMVAPRGFREPSNGPSSGTELPRRGVQGAERYGAPASERCVTFSAAGSLHRFESLMLGELRNGYSILWISDMYPRQWTAHPGYSMRAGIATERSLECQASQAN